MSVELPKELEEKLARFAATRGPQTAAPACALTKPGKCCGGRGYKVAERGALTVAELCTCVASCPACFGRARLVDQGLSKACREPSPSKLANLITSAQIPARYSDATLDHFMNFSGNGKTVVAQLKRWAAGFKPIKGTGIVLGGSIGVGKTYMLAALTRALIDRGISVRFADFFQLLNELKAAYSDGKGDPALLMPLINVDVLVIDELGKGRNSDWEKTIADNLISGRYNQNKTIIASTNYKFQNKSSNHTYNIDLESDLNNRSDFSPDQFGSLEARLGQRVYSRLREMTSFVELTGTDYRPVLASGGV